MGCAFYSQLPTQTKTKKEQESGKADQSTAGQNSREKRRVLLHKQCSRYRKIVPY